MDAAAPFVVLKGCLAVHGLSVRPGEKRVTPGKDWEIIQISRKKAYGCGEHGDKLVEGLTLYLHRDYPDLSSSLSIFLSDEARLSIEAELGVCPGALPGGVDADGDVTLVTEQLLVICMSFQIEDYSDRVYFLVYDSTDASLYIIPDIPLGYVASYTLAPVPRFTGVGRDHELVLLARTYVIQFGVNINRLCMCTPETRENAGSGGAGLWQVKTRCFPDLPYAFSVDEVFSFRGMLFWADLAQGLVHCDPVPAGDSGPVDFGFIGLPRGYMVDEQMAPEPMNMTRTISCAGGSIQFVCIDRDSSHPGSHTVNVWTLDLDHLQWEAHKGFPCLWKEIWGLGGFMDAEARDVVPQYPVLMPGGALCLLLSNMPQKPGFICSFDMCNKRPLWSGTVRGYGSIESRILPCNFFTKYYPTPHKRVLPTHKRKLPTHKRKLPSTKQSLDQWCGCSERVGLKQERI